MIYCRHGHEESISTTECSFRREPETGSRRSAAAHNPLQLLIVIALIVGFSTISAIAQVGNNSAFAAAWIALLASALLLTVAVAVWRRSIGGNRTARHEQSQATGQYRDNVATRPTGREASPRSFRQRLAAYLHLPESEVLPPRPRPTSTMSFWSSVPLTQRTTVMKSVDYIRAILERIRHAVRGG